MNTTNPLFNANRLKIGIFGTNGRGGAKTRVPEAYQATWPAAVATAQLADRAGFEAIVAYARWKGYIPGRPHHPSGFVLDPFTFAAGIAQATHYSSVMATSHAPTIHPVTCAKQCATIDIISGGRFGLNVVGGWNKHELDMFGTPLKEHDARYDELEEWLGIMERLWTETEEFDVAGRYFNIVKAVSLPKPVQRPRPPIMNAGGSPRGMRFAAQHADLCFLILRSDDMGEVARQIAAYKQMARVEFGRTVQVWTFCPMVQRATRAAAEAYLQHFAVEMEDKEALDGWTAGLGSQTQIVSPEKLAEFRKRFAAGAGGNILVGTARDIADQLEALNTAGLDGVVFTWVDFLDGMRRFIGEVLPELERRGLRAPYAGPSATAI